MLEDHSAGREKRVDVIGDSSSWCCTMQNGYTWFRDEMPSGIHFLVVSRRLRKSLEK